MKVELSIIDKETKLRVATKALWGILFSTILLSVLQLLISIRVAWYFTPVITDHVWQFLGICWLTSFCIGPFIKALARFLNRQAVNSALVNIKEINESNPLTK